VHAASGFNPPDAEVPVPAPETRTPEVPEVFAPPMPQESELSTEAWAQDSPPPAVTPVEPPFELVFNAGPQVVEDESELLSRVDLVDPEQTEARHREPLSASAPEALSNQQPFAPEAQPIVAHGVGGEFQPAEPAALASLEQFLKAIQRARGERAAAR